MYLSQFEYFKIFDIYTQLFFILNKVLRKLQAYLQLPKLICLSVTQELQKLIKKL
jgi:hypothetical protein